MPRLSPPGSLPPLCPPRLSPRALSQFGLCAPPISLPARPDPSGVVCREGLLRDIGSKALLVGPLHLLGSGSGCMPRENRPGPMWHGSGTATQRHTPTLGMVRAPEP